MRKKKKTRKGGEVEIKANTQNPPKASQKKEREKNTEKQNMFRGIYIIYNI